MLEGIEPVKIFHQFLFLTVSQLDNISRRKLIWIVSYGLVNHLGCYAIQFSNISVKDDLRIPDDNDFTFCFCNIFLMSHNFFFLSYSLAKIRLFLVTSKILGKKYLKRGKRKKKRRLPELRAAYWMLFFNLLIISKCLGGYYSSLFFSKSIIFFISGKALRNLSGMSSNVL